MELECVHYAMELHVLHLQQMRAERISFFSFLYLLKLLSYARVLAARDDAYIYIPIHP